MRRNRWKSGEWRVVDQESGVKRYASQVVMDYKGSYVTRRYADMEQPQDFVKSLDDPKPLPFYSLPETDFTLNNVVYNTVGQSGVANTIVGAAEHLYPRGNI